MLQLKPHLCLCKWSSHSLRSGQGLCPPGATSSLLLCSSHFKSWWRCCSKEMDSCLSVCAAQTCCAPSVPCQMKQGAMSIQFAQSLCIPALCALFLEPSQHFLEFLWQNEPLCWSVVVLFICSFLWLERKISKNEKVSNSCISSSYDFWSNTHIPVCASELSTYLFSFFRSGCVKYL